MSAEVVHVELSYSFKGYQRKSRTHHWVKNDGEYILSGNNHSQMTIVPEKDKAIDGVIVSFRKEGQEPDECYLLPNRIELERAGLVELFGAGRVTEFDIVSIKTSGAPPKK